MEKLLIPSPTSRGLCDTCAQYNWAWHLTRHLPGRVPTPLFKYEESLGKQSIESGQGARVECPLSELGYAKWYRVDRAPYIGVYYVNEANDCTWFELAPIIILQSSRYCSFCDILRQAAKKAELQLPPEIYVKC